jgi:hypothetical protein
VKTRSIPIAAWRAAAPVLAPSLLNATFI